MVAITKAKIFTLIFIGVFLATSTLALCAYSLAATEVDSNELSHYKQSGPGYDIYLPKSNNMNFEEMIFLVNYGNDPLILNITGEIYNQNKQYAYHVIEPESSQWIKVTFLDVGADYTLWLGTAEQPLLIVPLGREVEEYTPPSSGWVYLPPTPSDPKVYTAAEWEDMVSSFWALIAQMSMESVMFVSFAAVGGIAAGVAVKSKTKFIAPTDPISTIIILGGCADFALQLSPIGMYWIPLLAGYVIAYLIYHIRWVGRGTIDYATQTVKIDPYVTYNTADGQPAIQEQTWRGAIARMLGHHHTLGTDGALVESWACEFKKPWMPRLTSGLIWVEKEELDIKEEKWGPWRIKEKSSRWILADASTARKVDLLTKADALSEQIEERRNDKMELTRLRAEKEAMTIKTSGQILRDIQSYSITSAIERLATAEPKQKLPDNEERLTATEKIETKVKEEEK